MLPLQASGAGSDGSESVFRIPQSSSITEASPIDFLLSYPGHSLWGGLNLLQWCSRCIRLPQSAGRGYLRIVFS